MNSVRVMRTRADSNDHCYSGKPRPLSGKLRPLLLLSIEF